MMCLYVLRFYLMLLILYFALPTLENSFGKPGEDKLVVRRVNVTGVFHGPVPVVQDKLSLRIDT